MAFWNACRLSIGLRVGSVVGNGFGFWDLIDALRLTDLHFALLSICGVTPILGSGPASLLELGVPGLPSASADGSVSRGALCGARLAWLHSPAKGPTANDT
jgi:hypothetical protein